MVELAFGNNQRRLTRRPGLSCALGLFLVGAAFSACDGDDADSIAGDDDHEVGGEAGLGGTNATGGAAGRGGTSGTTSVGGEAGMDGTGGSRPPRGGSGGTDAGTGGDGARAGEGGESGGDSGGGGESGGGPTTVCGNGIVEGNEACDDHNTAADDGCTTCAIDSGWACDAAPSICVPRVVAIDGGIDHTCVLLGTGKMQCWGRGGPIGYPGFGNVGDDEPPAARGPLELDGAIRAIGLGGNVSCAILESGALRCWGNGGYGQLGYGNTDSINEATLAGNVDVGSPVLQVVVGESHTCALLSTHQVRCWGYGPIGTSGTVGDDETPAMVPEVDVGGPVVELAAGQFHTCARLENGAVRCWGQNNSGELGYRHTNYIGDDETPASAGDIDVGGPARQIVAGRSHTCALLTTGKVRCWGGGALGYGHTNNIGDDETPAAAGDIDLGVVAESIVSGGGHICALTAARTLHCWGGYFSRFGGVPTIGDDELPSSVPPVNVGGPVELVGSGDDHTCARLPGSKLRCWGDNYFYGTLGLGTVDYQFDFVGDDEPPASVWFVSYY